MVLLQVLILIGVGLWVFHARVHGSWLLAWVAILIGITCFVSIGFLVTGLVRTSEAARGVASAISFPMMFLSGIFIPLSQLPSALQGIVHILPSTYLSDALHQVMNSGKGITAIETDLLVLVAWAVVCFGLASRRFTWE
jgi:ABC-2 type transport system permease protein